MGGSRLFSLNVLLQGMIVEDTAAKISVDPLPSSPAFRTKKTGQEGDCGGERVEKEK